MQSATYVVRLYVVSNQTHVSQQTVTHTKHAGKQLRAICSFSWFCSQLCRFNTYVSVHFKCPAYILYVGRTVWTSLPLCAALHFMASCVSFGKRKDCARTCSEPLLPQVSLVVQLACQKLPRNQPSRQRLCKAPREGKASWVPFLTSIKSL